LRPLLGRRAAALEHAWLTADRSERHEIEIVAELLARRVRSERSILLAPPDKQQADGPLRLGRILHGTTELGWLGIHENELMQHAAITGRSGSGKSTLCLRILLQLIERRIPWLVFDYKRSTRHLRSLDLARDVRIVTLGRDIGATMCFNILVPPPGTTPDVHQRRLIELIADSWYAGDGVISLLERAFTEAYAKLAPKWPTIADIKQIVDDTPAKSRELLWKTSAMRILQQLTTGQLGRILNTRRDADALTQLRQHHTVIELDGLAVNDANMLTSFIVQHLTHQLLAEPQREKLRFVCLIEEAHHLLAKREGGRESVLETALREGREVGLGIMLADQCISAISSTALANCYSIICLNVRQRADITAASGSLLLGERQRDLLSILPVGEAVARLSDRWPHAVHIKIPPLNINKGAITDADVRLAHLNGPYAIAALDSPQSDSAVSTDSALNSCASSGAEANSARPPPDKTDSSTDSTHDGPHDAQAPTRTDLASPRPPPPEALQRQFSATARDDAGPLDDPHHGSECRALLESIARQPLLSVTARFESLRLSRRKGTALKQALVEEGYITPVDLLTPKGRTVLLALTEQARVWLVRHRIPISPVRGSLIHAWWQQRLAEQLRAAGWQVKLESTVDGHAFDLAAHRDGHKLLMEVETGRSDWLKNLTHLERTAADHKAVLWLDAASHKRARDAAAATIAVLAPAEVDRWIGRWGRWGG